MAEQSNERIDRKLAQKRHLIMLGKSEDLYLGTIYLQIYPYGLDRDSNSRTVEIKKVGI